MEIIGQNIRDGATLKTHQVDFVGLKFTQASKYLTQVKIYHLTIKPASTELPIYCVT